ncbi:antibiotic biosynthesis monooxygenase family protein [Desulfomarina sp.]
MTVKIIIQRTVNDDNILELTMLLKKLRSLTLEQPGYISGETLNRIDNKNECMVISTWRSVEDWNEWVNNPKRREIQDQIDTLLGRETEYAMYST